MFSEGSNTLSMRKDLGISVLSNQYLTNVRDDMRSCMAFLYTVKFKDILKEDNLRL